MRKIIAALLGAAAVSIACAPAAFAADMPVKVPGGIVQSSPVYVWADGSYQSIRLPTYDLGYRLQQTPGAAIGAANTFDPRASGYGVSGGIGFVLPPGMALSNFGTNARIEFAVSYVNATASQSGSTATGITGNHALPLLNGLTWFAGGCGGPVVGCTVSGVLNTKYSSWQGSAKYATDFNLNGITVTPSLALFGGNSRNNQTLSETNLFPGAGNLSQYNADTTLNSRDWGGRFGMSGSVPVTTWLTFVAGGNVGLAARNVSLNGSDATAATIGGTPFFFPNSSSISVSQTTAAFVANAETSVIIRLAPKWSLRAFAGLNYDNKVAGVSAPAIVLPIGTGGTSTPAGIYYQAETSYYAGGGLSVKF